MTSNRRKASRPAVRAAVALALVAAMAIGGAPTVLAPAAAAMTTGQDNSRHRPASYLLALGDSISFGFQSAKVGAPPDPLAFDSGYANVLAARDPRLQITNYSCPGESTPTLIAGGCPWRAAGFALHDNYSGSQLAASVAFLRAHRSSSGTVSLAVWGNDILTLITGCGGDLTCVAERAPAEIRAFAARLGVILRSLRSGAPAADIVVVGAFHSFPPPSPLVDSLYASLNAAITTTATSVRARIADTAMVFNPPDPALRAAAICNLTLVCVTNGADGHPSDAGYVAIADAVIAATCSPGGRSSTPVGLCGR